MKKILLFLLPVILLASCSKVNKIVNRHIAQSCNFSPITDSVRGLLAAGLVHADSSHAGNPLICDSVYTVEMALGQKWSHGNKGLLIAGILILIIGLGIFIRYTSSGGNNQGSVILPFATILIGGMFIGGFYYFSESRDIKKADYQTYMSKGGIPDGWWDSPAQSY